MQTRVNRRKFIVSATCSICGSVILPSCAQVPLTNRNQLNLYDSNLPIDKMFSSAKFVFKDGENIVKDGRVIKYKESRTHCLKFDYDVSIKKDIQKWFNKNYAFDIDNLSVDTEFFRLNNFKFLNIN